MFFAKSFSGMMATFVLLLASNLSAMKLPRSKVSKIPLLSEDYIIAVPLLGGGHVSTIDFLYAPWKMFWLCPSDNNYSDRVLGGKMLMLSKKKRKDDMMQVHACKTSCSVCKPYNILFC